MMRGNMYKYYSVVKTWDRFLEKKIPTLSFKLDKNYPVDRMFFGVQGYSSIPSEFTNRDDFPLLKEVSKTRLVKETKMVRNGLSEDTRRNDYDAEVFLKEENYIAIEEIQEGSNELVKAVKAWKLQKEEAFAEQMEDYNKDKEEALEALKECAKDIKRWCDISALFDEAQEKGIDPTPYKLIWETERELEKTAKETAEKQKELEEQQEKEKEEAAKPLATMDDLLKKYNKK